MPVSPPVIKTTELLLMDPVLQDMPHAAEAERGSVQRLVRVSEGALQRAPGPPKTSLQGLYGSHARSFVALLKKTL
jgi:hypothetical protein